MTFPIHLMSHSAQEGAKAQLDLQMNRRGFGYGIDSLSHYVVGVGIGLNRAVVTLLEDTPYNIEDNIPTELTDSYEGLPVDIEYSGPLYTLQGRGGRSGATIIVAARSIRRRFRPKCLIIALPVAPKDTVKLLKKEADLVEVVTSPSSHFHVVGQYYQDFKPTEDEQLQYFRDDRYYY